ncbi:MAG TPA: carbohydrate-binding protein [Blastocatellia bacterium]|nr:carbohydrate-binding protein [Blastocatellia bacterium]
MNLKRAAGFGFLALCPIIGSIILGSIIAREDPQTVDVWVTTDDQRMKLQKQTSIAFLTDSSIGPNAVFVDESQVYQTIEGFGASFTDSAAFLLNQRVPASQLDSVLNDLFGRPNGIGVSFVRNPMGASDLSRSIYSYDDLPPGQTDPNLDSFSIARDLTDIVPLIRKAKQINPDLKVMANPWSPPGWMKTSGSMIGGSLRSSMYTAFANYFVKYVKAYEAQGIPIDYISLQNEPLYVPSDYPGLSMDAATQTVVLRDYVLPALSAANINARVLVYDHNWDRPDYPQTVLSDPVLAGSPQVAGIAWHGYGGTPGAMTTSETRFPGKGNYETEHSGGTWVSDQVKTDFEEIVQVMRNWGKTFVKWSLALDQNRGPHTGGCGTCSPLVTVDSTTGAVSRSIDYYTLGHFSKFVLPGARRIYSSNADGFVTAGFKNPDESTALVVYNETTNARPVQVVWGNRSFTYSLEALSGATFIWNGSQTGGYSVTAVTREIQASSFSDTLGLQTESTSDTNGGYDVGYADDGDWALYKNIDFGAEVHSVAVRLASAGSGGVLEFRVGSAAGPLIGSVVVPVTGGWQTWTTVTGSISGAAGVNDLCIVFKGTSNIGNVNWFQFGTAGANDPVILSVGRNGKNLVVDGRSFVDGSKIELDGEPQRTIPDEQSPATRLIGKKSLKSIEPGQTRQVQVRNPDGSRSNVVTFTR